MPAKTSEWYRPENERHRRHDEYGVIQVFDDGDKRFLCFGSADEQSCQLRSRPSQLQHEYARAMLAVITLMPESQLDNSGKGMSVTLLGLGGGTLASAIHRVLPETQITAVELRRAVAQVARQYFALPRTPKICVQVMEASEYLHQADAEQAQLLVSDLYLSEGADQRQLQASYIDACWVHLAEGGWLVVNLWREHREQSLWLSQLKQRFGLVLHATTADGNWIIWAQKCEVAIELPVQQKHEIRQRCKHHSVEAGFNLWRSVKPFLRYG